WLVALRLFDGLAGRRFAARNRRLWYPEIPARLAHCVRQREPSTRPPQVEQVALPVTGKVRPHASLVAREMHTKALPRLAGRRARAPFVAVPLALRQQVPAHALGIPRQQLRNLGG